MKKGYVTFDKLIIGISWAILAFGGWTFGREYPLVTFLIFGLVLSGIL